MRRRVIAAWVLFACTIALALVWVVGVASSPRGAELQFLLPTLGGALLGLLLVRRQPENRIGLVFLLAAFGGVVADASSVAQSWAVEHELDGLAVLAFNIGEVGWGMMWLGAFVVLPLLFPTGRLLSSRWAWVLWVGGVSMILAVGANLFVEETCVRWAAEGNCLRVVSNSIGIAGLDTETTDLILLPAFAMPFLAVASMIVRYRRSGRVERLQLQWVLLACLLLAAFLLVSYVGLPDFLEDWMAALALFGLPLAAFVAITRYRLYEIDRIVSRTVTYVLVLATLGAAYAVVFYVFTEALPFEDDLAVAASTLLAAAMFTPLRRKLQQVVDRRFDRARYDSQRVLDELSGSMRDPADPETVQAAWVSAVVGTMQPSSVAVWVREGR